MDELEKIYDHVQSLKNFDYVFYCGGEYWKPHRTFNDFKLTHEDLKIEKDDFENLKESLEHVWYFCDTIFLEDIAEEENIHVLDYCFHGERMGWKVGDEYWLIYNFACNRLEIRKADTQKWTPLEKFFVNNDLELRFKIGYFVDNDPNNLKLTHEDYENVPIKYVQNFGVNSFPDRIEISLNGFGEEDEDLTSIYQIFDYYIHRSSFNENGYNNELNDVIYDLYFNENKMIHELNENYFKYKKRKIYNLYVKNEVEDMNKIYEMVLKYSHQLKFYQKKFQNNK
jgi:hypothetical protein